MKDPLRALFASLVGLDDTKLSAMEDTYEVRNVSTFLGDGFTVDTSRVTDTDPHIPYETAIRDAHYTNDWIIVELTSTKEEAQLAHDRWVSLMKDTKLAQLTDVGISEVTLKKDQVLGKGWRVYKRIN